MLTSALSSNVADDPAKKTFKQQRKFFGRSVALERQKALDECKSRVEAIAKDCKSQNRKFRDLEFDIEHDTQRCLHGFGRRPEIFKPSDIQRTSQIFESPQFFIDGANSNDIVQGKKLGDCYLLSALSTMATCKGLVEESCVARDEEAGVYGFIFFRDDVWVTVIVDDLLFTSNSIFEELQPESQALFHNDKKSYDASARKTGKSLYFSRSGTENETWVPLYEKAFAKFYGSYSALDKGQEGEAIEDLTGGVNSFISVKDIRKFEDFWTNELLHGTEVRLFGCSLSTTLENKTHVRVDGLLRGHAYSVLRAVEYKGKRFVVIRNPWGASEWRGPWSDGSKEWSKEWLPDALEILGHTFGDDGQFVMEYVRYLPVSLDFLAGKDLSEVTIEDGAQDRGVGTSVLLAAPEEETENVYNSEDNTGDPDVEDGAQDPGVGTSAPLAAPDQETKSVYSSEDDCNIGDPDEGAAAPAAPAEKTNDMCLRAIVDPHDNAVYLGLRVYTKEGAASIESQLR
ncbi:hypothetical protein H0H93_007335 [Arthromyces matolae]|nr:hypothetical protein H0H93_007335 [Arthromyces matolae]